MENLRARLIGKGDRVVVVEGLRDDVNVAFTLREACGLVESLHAARVAHEAVGNRRKFLRFTQGGMVSNSANGIRCLISGVDFEVPFAGVQAVIDELWITIRDEIDLDAYRCDSCSMRFTVNEADEAQRRCTRCGGRLEHSPAVCVGCGNVLNGDGSCSANCLYTRDHGPKEVDYRCSQCNLGSSFAEVEAAGGVCPRCCSDELIKGVE